MHERSHEAIPTSNKPNHHQDSPFPQHLGLDPDVTRATQKELDAMDAQARVAPPSGLPEKVLQQLNKENPVTKFIRDVKAKLGK